MIHIFLNEASSAPIVVFSIYRAKRIRQRVAVLLTTLEALKTELGTSIQPLKKSTVYVSVPISAPPAHGQY
jgi:hypothetical protein